MAYTPNTYATDGSTTEFAITFPFLREADVVVSILDSNSAVVSAFDFEIFLDGSFKARVVADGTITDNTPTPLPAGYTLTISRNTDISTLGTTFVDGVSLRAADINILLNQQNYALQEAVAELSSALGKNIPETAWDAEALRIENLGAPTNANDAMRKVDIDSGIGPAITTVAGIASDVTDVAAATANIAAVVVDINGTDTIGTVAGSIANVNAVGTNINDVTAVAADQADIGVVATNLSGADTIGTVAGSIANVNAVGGSIANVNAVAADEVDIGVVATDLSGSDTIGTVAGIASDVTTVAGINAAVSNVSSISADVTAVNADGADIGVVAADLSGPDTIGTVAGSIANVNTLAAQDSNITTLTQAANLTALQNAATNAAAAEAALQAFNRTYLGAYSADPSADGNGDPLTDGDLYYNTTSNNLKFYDAGNTVWVTLNNSVQVNAAATLGATGDVTFATGPSYQDFLMRDNSNPAQWVNVNPSTVKSTLAIAAGDVSGLGTAAAAATTDFATAAQGTTADAALQPGDVVDNLTSTSTTAPLSAAQGKALQDDKAASGFAIAMSIVF